VGMSPEEAEAVASSAGFSLADSGTAVYSSQYAPGTIVSQSPSAYSKVIPGATIYYNVATDQLPSWYTKWPNGWDPEVAPDDWWGGSWPPAEFEYNPPSGWPSDDDGGNNNDDDDDRNRGRGNRD